MVIFLNRRKKMWEKIKSWFGWRKKSEYEQLYEGLKDLFRKIDDLKLAKDLNESLSIETASEIGLIKGPKYMEDVDLNNEKVKVRSAGEYADDYLPFYYKVSVDDLIDLEDTLGSEKFLEIWNLFNVSFPISELNLEENGKQIKFRLISIPRSKTLKCDSEFEKGINKFKEIILNKTE
jgi:hypothetical protein